MSKTERPSHSPRTLAERAHPDDRDTIAVGKRRRHRTVTVNLKESPLAWLHSRALVSERQYQAGERLRSDYERANLCPRTTMCWDNAAPISRVARGAPLPADPSTTMLDAKRRFDAALTCVGPGLADICWRTLCAGEGISSAERALGWPSRSGRVVLTLALDRLAAFYGVSGAGRPRA